jgi:hypothetical protein
MALSQRWGSISRRCRIGVSDESASSPDEEFYAVLGGGFSTFGTVEASDGSDTTELSSDNYEAQEGIPGTADTSNDWSTDGSQW